MPCVCNMAFKCSNTIEVIGTPAFGRFYHNVNAAYSTHKKQRVACLVSNLTLGKYQTPKEQDVGHILDRKAWP